MVECTWKFFFFFWLVPLLPSKIPFVCSVKKTWQLHLLQLFVAILLPQANAFMEINVTSHTTYLHLLLQTAVTFHHRPLLLHSLHPLLPSLGFIILFNTPKRPWKPFQVFLLLFLLLCSFFVSCFFSILLLALLDFFFRVLLYFSIPPNIPIYNNSAAFIFLLAYIHFSITSPSPPAAAVMTSFYLLCDALLLCWVLPVELP